MFWTRSSHETRRQKVLDELLELDPAERRGRLEMAVAAGDVRANEADAALQVVRRLDALRVMTISASRSLPAGILRVQSTPMRTMGEAEAESADMAPAGPAEDAEEEARGAPPLAEPAVIPIGVAPEPARPSLDWAPLPIDAVVAATRLIAADLAARKALARSSRERRLRMAAGDWLIPAPSLALPPLPAEQLPAPLVDDAGVEARSEESWPSMSWLRP